MTDGNRTLFTVGNQLQLSRGNALQHQVALNGLGTTLAQSQVVLAGTALVGVTFQNDALAAGLQVTSVNVQSAHGFRLQVGAVVLEVEGGDGAQSGFVAHAAVDGTRVGAIASVRVDSTGASASTSAFTGGVAALGGTAHGDSHGQGQCSELAEFQHFHHVTPKRTAMLVFLRTFLISRQFR